MNDVRKPRKKRLTVYNTDRYFNINLMLREELESKVKVTKLNETDIEKQMDELELKSNRLKVKDDKEYLVYQESYSNDTLLNKLMNHAGSLTYYTDTTVPYYVIKGLANNVTSEAVFSSREDFTYDEIDNVALTSSATSVIVDVPVVIPDISPYDILFMLHPLKNHVDKVQLSFPRLRPNEMSERHKKYYHKVGDFYEVKPKIKYKYFKHIQTSLSIWKMNIYIVCDSKDDYQTLDKMVQRDLDKRNPNRVKDRVSYDG